MYYCFFLMLYYLWERFPHYTLFHLFKSITLRSLGALLCSFFLVWVMAPSFIRWMKSKAIQPLREDGPSSHLITKKGTPTMGGTLILCAYASTLLLWVNWQNTYVWISTWVLMGCGALGAWDDLLKVTRSNPKGLPERWKLAGQIVVASGAMTMLVTLTPCAYSLSFPFFKKAVFIIGPYLFALWGMWIIIGISNAVNLTDGLDGLAIGPVMMACGVLAIMAYVSGHYEFSHYLHASFVPSSGELCILCASLIGAGLGFLWYNCPPAMIMMGDMGSLALGGFLAIVAIIIKQEFLLLVVGGIFVIETLSVIIQVVVFKKTGRRVFLMAPIHHHFEKKGWSESTVVFRFWIVSILLGVLALSCLKIR